MYSVHIVQGWAIEWDCLKKQWGGGGYDEIKPGVMELCVCLPLSRANLSPVPAISDACSICRISQSVDGDSGLTHVTTCFLTHGSCVPLTCPQSYL